MLDAVSIPLRRLGGTAERQNGSLTDDEHRTCGSLQSDPTDGENGSPSVNGVLEHIQNSNLTSHFAFLVDGCFDLGDLDVDWRARRPEPL